MCLALPHAFGDSSVHKLRFEQCRPLDFFCVFPQRLLARSPFCLKADVFEMYTFGRMSLTKPAFGFLRLGIWRQIPNARLEITFQVTFGNMSLHIPAFRATRFELRSERARLTFGAARRLAYSKLYEFRILIYSIFPLSRVL